MKVNYLWWHCWSLVRHVFFSPPSDVSTKTDWRQKSGKMLFQCLDQAGEGELQPHEVYFLDKWLLDDTQLPVVWWTDGVEIKGFWTRSLSIVSWVSGLFCVFVCSIWWFDDWICVQKKNPKEVDDTSSGFLNCFLVQLTTRIHRYPSARCKKGQTHVFSSSYSICLSWHIQEFFFVTYNLDMFCAFLNPTNFAIQYMFPT